MLGWIVVLAAGALGVRAHVRAVSADNARRVALRAAASSPQGQTLMAAASGLYVLPVGPRT